MNSEVLNSWKEVAAYLGRGVRTVQRWERELGLPVRRPRGKDRSAVIALKPELDHWLQKTPNHETKRSSEFKHNSTVFAQRVATFQQQTNLLAAQLRILETHASQAALLTTQLSRNRRNPVRMSRTEFMNEGLAPKTNGNQLQHTNGLPPPGE